ncbi:MAG TPA: restriction endonuclease [Candidatus Limnocylindrales bacterium]|nr:restriction endonuclease [Candidatus Limnocylindrales bacterium]
MAVPDYQSIMLPLMHFLSDGGEHSMRDLTEHLAQFFRLTETEREDLLPSGKQRRFDNRVGWARTALKKAGLLEIPREAYVRISPRGRELLAERPEKITDKLLMRYPEYLQYKGFDSQQNAEATSQTGAEPGASPKERLEFAFGELQRTLLGDILEKVKASTPAFFETLVVDLLSAMGYGGSRRDAARALGRSGDGGIDGEIKEDPLGLDMIYIQAKRYTTGNVPAAAVRDFVGALVGKNARKGVFITTSGFAADALKFADRVEGKRLVLIDGTTLAKLMVENGVGVAITDTLKIGKIDEDYFDQG